MDPEQQTSSLLAPSVENLAAIKVFPLIPALRRDITNTIDSALSWDQLTAADINFSIVRPLVNKYARLRNMAVVYACLVVRSYFLTEAESDLAFAGVMISRANLCEIMAMKLLSRFAHNYIQLVAVLTTTWNPLVGASSHIVDEVKLALNAHDDADVDSAQSAIEMAISTSAKNFLASPVTQQVVNDIYSGRVVFSIAAQRSILADNYKPRAIEIYNPHNAPFINHYRLRVPKYGTYLDFLNFALLLLTFVLCLSNHDRTQLTFWEVAFITLGSAFALEEYTASTEHGWIIYIASMWNAFDFAFIVVFFAYLGMRVHGLNNGDLAMSDMAFDILACGACILFPRLAFLAVSNNMVVLSLRAMIAQFVFFIAIASICFSGLLFTLWTLASDDPVGHGQWTFKSIAWLMVQIWFGNTYLSFAQAASFHPLFGPILMTMFAALSNTLLLTILISILSNTVARIDANATQEYLFQYTITTIEGVKSDALFSYQPPFNILALAILKPLSYMVTPRALHRINVFLIKLTSLPQLLLIGLYERHLLSGGPGKLRAQGKDAAQSLFQSLPRHIKNMPFVEAVVGSAVGDLYEAIFAVEGGEGVEGEEGLFDGFEEEEEYRIRVVSVDGGEGGRRGKRASRSRSSRRGVGSPASAHRRVAPAPLDEPTMPPPPASPQRRRHPQQPRDQVLSLLSPTTIMSSPETSSSPLSAGGGAAVSGEANNRSPLARLFGSRFSSAASVRGEGEGGGGDAGMAFAQVAQAAQAQAAQAQAAAQIQAQAAVSTSASMRHIEALVDAVSHLPVNKLKEEMKELQDRQARIENLLLMLTRGMRNESSLGTTSPAHRQSSMSIGIHHLTRANEEVMSWVDATAREPLSYQSFLYFILPPIVLYYVTALLVLRPNTSTLRLALLPVTLYTAFRAATGVDLGKGCEEEERLAYLSHGLLLAMSVLSMRVSIWAFEPEPYTRDTPSASHFLDALDLSFNLRGIGWSWSAGLKLPPDNRPLSSKPLFLLSTLRSAILTYLAFDCLYLTVQSFPGAALSSPTGAAATIFDPTLPPLHRYARSSLISFLCGLVIYTSIHCVHSILAVISVILFSHNPSLYPPAFHSPWAATSLTQFWAARWHQFFRHTFLYFAGVPFTRLLPLGRAGGVLAVFFASGLLHYFGLWGMGRGSDFIPVVGFFLLNGVGILLEHAFRSLTGKRVAGFPGWLWVNIWVVGWANMLVEAWLSRGLAGSKFQPEHTRPAVLLVRFIKERLS